MPLADQDPSLIQDFLTESGELIEQLDSDLLELEDTGGSDDLLNSIFRALHTIKGAASFFDLGAVTTFAHAAEFALDKLRKGEVEVTPDTVDALLRSVDVLKHQLGEIEDGTDPGPAPAELLAILESIASGDTNRAPGDADTSPAETAATSNEPASKHLGATANALELPPEKLDVMPYMVEDLRESLTGLTELLNKAESPDADLAALGPAIVELGESAETTTEFFDLNQLKELVGLFVDAGEQLANVDAVCRPRLLVRLRAVIVLAEHASHALTEHAVLEWDVETLCDRCAIYARNNPDEAPETDSPMAALADDGVITPDIADATTTPSQHDLADQPISTEPTDHVEHKDAAAPGTSATPRSESQKKLESRGDTTIRVEVTRLEALMNLVGEMTLTKNQVLASARELTGLHLEQDLAERVQSAASDLDRITSELQQSVMRTRMQPLEKLLGRYPRIVRDLAKKTDKVIDLRIEGGDTEVDKSVLELLGDPLVHMLRNSVDHGIETPDTRSAAGKPPTGTLLLKAEHQGGHVRILVQDDGRGIDREIIGGKALAKGLVSEEQLAMMSDDEVFRFIFAPGFSTAEQVSDLSGRGVGMDVVNSNIKKLNGDVNVRSVLGQGTTIEILIPLTVATMAAMVVGVGPGEYAAPLSNIEEITRVSHADISSVRGQPVIRVRDEVIGLIDMRAELLQEQIDHDDGFIVIVSVGQEKAGLIVDRLIGQQEVVIKVLDDEYTSTGPFSGATIREDGRVNLIIDIVKLLRSHARSNAALA